MKKPPAKKLPLFRGKRIKTNHAIHLRIYPRKDSPYLQVEVRGKAVGRVRKSSGSMEHSTAAQFGDLLMRQLLRAKEQAATQPPPSEVSSQTSFDHA